MVRARLRCDVGNRLIGRGSMWFLLHVMVVCKVGQGRAMGMRDMQACGDKHKACRYAWGKVRAGVRASKRKTPISEQPLLRSRHWIRVSRSKRDLFMWMKRVRERCRFSHLTRVRERRRFRNVLLIHLCFRFRLYLKDGVRN